MADSNPKPNQSSSPFKGGGVFTSDNPQDVLQLENKPAWVALEVDDGGNLRGGVDKSFVDQLKAEGIKVYVWAPGYNGTETVEGVSALNDSAISAANQTGADGVIFQGETPQEIQAAYSAVGKTNLQTAIVSDGTYIPTGGWVGSKTTFLAEAYNNANPYASVPNAIANAQRTGATDVVPIYGYYSDRGVQPSMPISTYIQQSQTLGINNYGVFDIEGLAGNSSDEKAFSDSFGQTGADKPIPQLYNPTTQTNPFAGVGAFTASAPAFALSLAGTINWVGIKAGGGDGVGPGGNSDNSPDIITAAKNVGLAPIIWANPASDYASQIQANQEAIQLAQQYGASGVVFPAENADQIKAAQDSSGQAGMPTAVLAGSDTINQLGGWGGSVFLLGDGMTPDQLAAFAAANPKIVPIIPAYGATDDNHLMGDYLTAMQAKGVTGFGLFTLESMSYDPTNVNSFVNYLVQKATGALPAATVPTTGGSMPNSNPNPTPNKKKKPATNTTPGSDDNKPGQGINGPHYEPGTHGAPKAYQGGAPVMSGSDMTYSFKDKKGRMVTITTTASGAKVEQVEGEKAYQIAKPGTVDVPTPQWNGTPAAAGQKTNIAGVDAHGSILAVRDSKNASTVILQMSDGTYQSLNKDTGAVAGAGWWGDGKGGGVAKDGIGNSTTPAAASGGAGAGGGTGGSGSGGSSGGSGGSGQGGGGTPSAPAPTTAASGFPSRYVYTTGDPSSAGPVPDGVGIAIKVGGTDGATSDQIAAYKAAHPNNPIVIWAAPVDGQDPTATYSYAAGVANQIGASGFIAQGESADQMNAAAAVTDQVNVPKVIVTNGDTGVQWPPGWGLDFEYYPNTNNGNTPQNTTAFIQGVLAAGAPYAQITVGAGDWSATNITAQQYADALDYLKSQGINVDSVSIYIWNSMTPQQQQDFLNTLGVPATVTANTTPTPTPTPTTTTPKPKPTTPTTPPKKKTPAPTGTAPKKDETKLGIDGTHYEPGTHGAPGLYKGGATPVADKSYSFEDKAKHMVTMTTTETGAVVEQRAGINPKTGKPYTAYTAKKSPLADMPTPDWSSGSPSSTPGGSSSSSGGSGSGSGSASNKTGNSGVDSHGSVLASRDSKDGTKDIYQMSDGRYISVDKTTGAVADAGWWGDGKGGGKAQNGIGNSSSSDSGGGSGTDNNSNPSTPPAASNPPNNSANNQIKNGLDPAIGTAIGANVAASGGSVQGIGGTFVTDNSSPYGFSFIPKQQ